MPDFATPESIFEAFGDLFGDLFGGGGRRRGPQAGRDLGTSIEIDLLEAYRGCTQDGHIPSARSLLRLRRQRRTPRHARPRSAGSAAARACHRAAGLLRVSARPAAAAADAATSSPIRARLPRPRPCAGEANRPGGRAGRRGHRPAADAARRGRGWRAGAPRGDLYLRDPRPRARAVPPRRRAT